MAPEVDPVLTDTQNWDSHSHRALYESVHVNNDPGQSGEIGSEWAQFATELAESAQVITHRIVSTETGWTGESADGARIAIKKLSDWISGTAQTAGQVGDRVADQGRVMEDARASMPEPVEFTWTGATGTMVGGGISTLLASTADVQAANAKAQAAKELAVTVMTNMEANSRAIDQTTPVFTAPFNPTTGKTEEPQMVALRRVEAPTAGGAVDGLPMMAMRSERLEAARLDAPQDPTASERTTAAAAYAPPVLPGGSVDSGGGAGFGGGGAGSGGYTGSAGVGGYAGGGGYPGGAGGFTGGGYPGGSAVAAGGGSYPGGAYTGGAYQGSTGSGHSDDDSDELGSYRQGGTTTAAEAAGSIPVAHPYQPPVAGGGYGYSDTTNYNGAGGTGYGGGFSGNTGRGSAPSRGTAPGSTGNPAGYLGTPGARPPGVPVEGVGGTGSTGRGAGGYGSVGAGGAGGFGGGATGGGFGGVGGVGGGVGGSGAVGGAGGQVNAGGSTGVVQPGRGGQSPTGSYPVGAPGAPGAAGGAMGGAPMGAGAGGRSEEDKERKSASYIMGGDLFDVPGENLPPSVIGGVKPKKKSGDQS